MVSKEEYDNVVNQLNLIRSSNGMAARMLELFQDRREADERSARLEKRLDEILDLNAKLELAVQVGREEIVALSAALKIHQSQPMLLKQIEDTLNDHSLSSTGALQKIRDIVLHR